MAAQILLLTGSPATRDQVTATLQEIDVDLEIVLVESSAQFRRELDSGRDVALAMVDESVEGGIGFDLARETTAKHPLVAMLVLVTFLDEATLATALDVGARSVLQLPPSLEQFSLRVHAALDWVARAHVASVDTSAPAGAVGQLVTVVGAKGGVGTTTVAVSLARAAREDRSVCLVDLDVRGGDVAAYCGITVRRSVVDLVDVATELNARSIGEVVYSAAENLTLMAAPVDAELGEELTEQATAQILSALRYQYDLVVVDAGCHLDEILVEAVEQSDAVYVVATPDVPAMRAVRRLSEAFERLDVQERDRARLVLNQTEKAREVQPGSAARLADMPLAVALPRDVKVLDPVMNSAQLLTAPLAQLDAAAAPLVATLGRPAPDPARPATAEVPGGTRNERGARRWFGRRRSARERGQLVAEFPVAFAMILAVAFLALHMILWGATYLFAQNAANSAARAVGLGAHDGAVAAAARDDLPDAWADGMSVTTSGGRATVRLSTPALVDLPEVAASASVYEEGR